MHGRYLFVVAAFALSSFAAPVPVAEVSANRACRHNYPC